MSIRAFARRLSPAAVEKAKVSAQRGGGDSVRYETDPAYRRTLISQPVNWPSPAGTLGSFNDGISRKF